MGSCTPLQDAASRGDLEEVERLLAAGADIDAQDEYGWTPLLEAAVRTERREVVERLIEWGADVDAGGEMHAAIRLSCCNRRGVQGMAPLHWLAVERAPFLVETAELLLARGARVDALLVAGARISPRDVHGWTPLHYGAWGAHLDVCELLLDAGADPASRDADGTTARMLADLVGDDRLVKLLDASAPSPGTPRRVPHHSP